MVRTAVIVGIWFVIWMIIGGAVGGLASTSKDIAPHVFYGVTNGAFFAVLASFAWPWIMPRLIDRWMSQGEGG